MNSLNNHMISSLHYQTSVTISNWKAFVWLLQFPSMSDNVLFCIHLCEDHENVKKTSSAIRFSDCEDIPQAAVQVMVVLRFFCAPLYTDELTICSKAHPSTWVIVIWNPYNKMNLSRKETNRIWEIKHPVHHICSAKNKIFLSIIFNTPVHKAKIKNVSNNTFVMKNYWFAKTFAATGQKKLGPLQTMYLSACRCLRIDGSSRADCLIVLRHY